ncbi:unnamed protein product, partial [Adineta steineri]
RLAKEDELEGLDLTAHGEGWEVVASRAVSDLVKKILDNQHNPNEMRESGTFELHYTPSDAKRKPFKVNLSKPQKTSDEQMNSPTISNP